MADERSWSPYTPARLTAPEPPHSLDLEMALLGELIMRNKAYAAVAGFLTEDHFCDAANRLIFRTIKAYLDAPGDGGGFVDVEMLVAAVGDAEELASLDGGRYIAELAAGASVTIIDVAAYARLIFDLWRRREIVRIADDMASDAMHHTDGKPVSAIFDRAFAEMDGILADSPGKTAFVTVGDAARSAIERAELARKSGGFIGLSTGYSTLDALIGGLAPSELTILAGRPGMGKSQLAGGIARGVAKQGTPVAILSLEMSPEQWASRYLAAETRIDNRVIRDGGYAIGQEQDLYDAARELDDLPIHICAEGGMTLSRMRARVGTLRREGIGLIIVDHLGLAAVEGRSQGRTNDVSAISRGLKLLAKDLDMPVLALSQLSRAVENRENKRPMLADLRDSGSIEQDADAVIFIYREHYYLLRDEPDLSASDDVREAWQASLTRTEREAEIIAAKLRDGEPGSIKMHYNPKLSTFGDIAFGGAFRT